MTIQSLILSQSSHDRKGVKNQNTHSMVLTFSFDPDFKIEKNKK